MARNNEVGDIVIMSESALENYGKKWAGIELQITHKATKYMPASEFYAKGTPQGFHPGYDAATGDPLYDLEVVKTGAPLSFSLYQWEVE